MALTDHEGKPAVTPTKLEVWRDYILPAEPINHPGPWRRRWLYLVFTVRRWLVDDRCASGAALLSIDTLLSAVPLLGVALAAVSMLDPESGAALLRDMFEHVMPSTRQARDSAQNVLRFAKNVTVMNLGTWGFLVALGIAFMLFATLESQFNEIWRVTRKRNIVIKFTMFYTLFTLGPLVLLFSLQQSFVSDVSGTPWAPFLTTATASILLNRLLPNSKVRWKAAIAGGVVSALLFELGKELFAFYVQHIASKTWEGLYGPLAIMPIFVIWSYLSWLVMLLGAEVAFVVQHARSIELQGYINPYVRKAKWVEKAAGRTAARLFLAAADSFDRRHYGVTREALADRFRLPLDRVSDIMGHLERKGYVLEADHPEEGFIPARPLDQVEVREILALFDGEETSNIRNDILTEVFDDLDRARNESIGDLTYADLVARHRAGVAEARRLREVKDTENTSGSHQVR